MDFDTYLNTFIEEETKDENEDSDNQFLLKTLDYQIVENEIIEEFNDLVSSFSNNKRMSSPGSLSEYLFWGDSNEIIEITSYSTIKLSMRQAQMVLDSINIDGKTGGWLNSFAIDDIGKILREKNEINTYCNVIQNESSEFKFNSNSTKIFLPFLMNGHYTLYVINLKENSIYYYNSLEGDELDQNIQFIQQHINIKNNTSINFEFIRAKCPKQLNTKDCGVYTILNMCHPKSGEGDGSINYNYDNNIREYVKESLRKNKIVKEIKKIYEMN